MQLKWLVILALSGCSVAKEQFDCKYEVGIGCKSITEVNQLVTAGLLGSNQQADNVNTLPKKVGEKPLRVWLAPYQEHGYSYAGTLVNTVVTN